MIEKLPPRTFVKGVRSFLGQAEFYRRFIKEFSKISKPLCSLLENDKTFDLSSNCLQTFNMLKKARIKALIMTTPYWTKPFEVMCDTSDYVVGGMLG